MSDDKERAAWEGPAQPAKTSAGQGPGWERELVTGLAYAALKEQRRARRWGVFFKLVLLAYLIALFFSFQGSDWDGAAIVHGEHTALVEIKGAIADNAEANADDVIAALREAFGAKDVRGVILRINSPGGSPVQAGYINDEIRRLREQHPDIPLYAVITDMCASGGYYIAAAADQIYANKASIVGSIGVRMSGLSTFGFVEAMKKLGIERRIFTAGEDKAFLDPFSPLRDDEVEHVKALLGNIHRQFIKVVKEGRGGRLKGDDSVLFSGLFWTGQQGLELGLVDALGSAGQVARDVIKAEKIVDYTHRPSPLERFTERFGVALVDGVASVLGVEQTGLR
ncbi:MAG TPA: S49 family peptidase [Gammaproteobacteria bacterium]|nr:S49 family peptidase [Gammaproteobacteria bacterium]